MRCSCQRKPVLATGAVPSLVSSPLFCLCKNLTQIPMASRHWSIIRILCSCQASVLTVSSFLGPIFLFTQLISFCDILCHREFLKQLSSWNMNITLVSMLSDTTYCSLLKAVTGLR